MSDRTISSAPTKTTFGYLPDGREVFQYTLKNTNGVSATTSNFGGLLTKLLVPSAAGKTEDIVLGFDSFDAWIKNEPYFGATVGRFGNRIANGQFSLDGKDYQLATNNEPAGIPCHLHGGIEGFSKKLWRTELNENGLSFHYLSPDGEEGYPGNLKVKVSYSLNENNELIWRALATCDAATPINLINHIYWNLSGNPENSISDHLLKINSESYLPTTPGMIPLPTAKKVLDTPFDFRETKTIASGLSSHDPDLEIANGYDHAFIIPGNGLRHFATISHPENNRRLDVFSNQPAMHFYTGNFLNNEIGKNGIHYPKRSGLCLETEAYPNAPNQPNFPSAILRPSETYEHTLVYKLSW